MANAIRVENISNADQEIAPGSGFIPPGGHADYSIDTFREKHERYAKARLEADPPLLKLTEFDSPEIERRDADLQKLADDERKAQEAKAAAELLVQAEKKAAEEQQAQEAKLAAERKAAEQQQAEEARLAAEKQAEELRQQNESSSGGSGHKRGR